MQQPKRRIPYAFHLEGWSRESGSQENLKKAANRIIPSDYEPLMDGSIFCPACFTNLNRIPKEKDIFSNQREPFFSHQKKWRNIPCDLRINKPQGKRYDSWEDARKAIENKELVIVSGFIQDEPEIKDDITPGDYTETPVEDIDGPPAKTPLARHTGEELELPSVITSVMGVCRNFDTHLFKYYQFPGRDFPMRLMDLLRDIRGVTDVDDDPKLYYAKIESSKNMGRTSSNIRMTWVTCNSSVKDFCIKTIDRVASRKGIKEGIESKGKIMLIYGKIVHSGIGLAIDQPAWGEYALLPDKYQSLLE
ncbi:hypothetical protein [Pseudomonas aeruginosa]|uniref:hypothetical protein n=1 Tax=Pseudomonas aeruginosa TaxID=287 RepID=UPI0009A452C5|nr:hypothetical protein [Pseudomonas aeruginosa]